MHLAPVPALKLTLNEIAFLVKHSEYWTGKDEAICVAQAWLESGGGYTNVYRPPYMNASGGQDTGLMQINSEAWGHIDPLILFDPIINLYWTRDIHNREQARGKNIWWPWNYGEGAWGPRSNPPRPARTDESINLAAAQEALANPVNPYWRMVDAGMDVHNLPVPPIGTFVSPLPTPTLKFGQASTEITKLQTVLKDMGLYSGTLVQYYGNGTAEAVAALQQMLANCGLWQYPINGREYSQELHRIWNGCLQFEYRRKGR